MHFAAAATAAISVVQSLGSIGEKQHSATSKAIGGSAGRYDASRSFGRTPHHHRGGPQGPNFSKLSGQRRC
jgi:hypothetical protein